MFIAIILSIFGIAGYLAVHDWLRNAHNTRYVQKILKRAALKITLNDWEGAHQDLIALIKEKKGGKRLALLNCQVLRGTKKFEEALQQACLASHQYPEELCFRLEEAKALYALERFDEALEAFTVCAPILREEADILFLATTLFEAGNVQRCKEVLEPLLSKTRNGDVLTLYGDCQFEDKHVHEAITFYKRALDAGFQRHHVYVQLGNAYRRLGNLQESEKIFRHLMDKDSMDPCATLGLGLCMQERNLHQKALLLYQSSPAWEKKDEHLLYQAALCALKLGKFSFAESCLTLLVENQQMLPKSLTFLGYTLECQKKWQNAEQIYLKLLQSSPADPQSYRALAWMFGVGHAVTITADQGMHFAHVALKLTNDLVAWEILSACEARVGNFIQAFQIQERLASLATTPRERNRHLHAMKNLKKNVPLDHNHILREMVA